MKPDQPADLRLRAREVFLEALDHPDAAAREALLDSECGSDFVLRHRVESMLGEHFLEDGFMERSAAGDALIEESDARIGSTIGRYKLIEKIGEGGMGVVYLAEQDAPLRRRVALKVIKLGMDTRAVLARFDGERQALALMDHPNIARILDGGATEAGRPYFVMEWVQGVPVTEFCARNALGIPERLPLFIDVCHAVQHAHQKGIIHRDLKPSNVLVTQVDGKPVPKVIDFGIAKAFAGRITEATIHTGLHPFFGTPAYMSPEQADLSPDIDTRTDIYSLGGLLYALLTGKPPFDDHELLVAGLDEMRRMIREVVPKRPSLASRLPSRTSFPTDLDWVVMKCLEKERSRRYETASALAADILRHVNHSPVLARPPSPWYVLSKAMRRNKVAFSAAGALSLALVAGIGSTSWQAVRARRAEERARAQAAEAISLKRQAIEQANLAKQQAELARQQSLTAQAVQEFLKENLLTVNSYHGTADADAFSHETSRAIVEKVARKMEGKFAEQPAVEADLRMALVRAFSALRNFSAMATNAQRVAEIRADLLGEDHSDTLEATANLAYATFQLDHKRQAHELLEEGIAVVRRSTNGLSLGASILVGTYGLILDHDGRHSDALPYLQEAISDHQRLKGSAHLWTTAWRLQYARAAENAGCMEDAEALCREGLQQCLNCGMTEHPMTDFFRFGLARILMKQGRWSDGLPLLHEVIAFRERTLPRNDFAILDARFWLARACELQGRSEEAVAIYREIGPIIEERLPFHGARYLCGEIGRFFLRAGLVADGKAILARLRQSFGPIAALGAGDLECVRQIDALLTQADPRESP